MEKNQKTLDIEEKEIQEMLDKGIHFGCFSDKLHPKMRDFCFGIRNSFAIIDLFKAKEETKKALEFLSQSKKAGLSFLIVGTKQVVQKLVEEFAREFNFPYVNQRWIGGLLTNFEVIKKRINLLKEMEEKAQSEEIKKMPKKEKIRFERKLERMKRKFSGVKNLEKLPDVLIVVDPAKEDIAVKEAIKKGVKTVGIAGLDSDPQKLDFFILANTNSLTSLKYVFSKIKEAFGK